MDPRRLLSLAAFGLLVSGCAVLRPAHPPAPTPVERSTPLAVTTPGSSPILSPVQGETAQVPPSPPPAAVPTEGRPYLAGVAPPERREQPGGPRPTGRSAIAAANQAARAASSADAFIGGVQVFAWAEGRVYDVWTAPLRVTALTLAPGETVSAKAAGDTVRWQIGESPSGEGASVRTHVLIKPLQTGLETNLVLTTNQRVYLLNLRSGPADAFNTAVAWDYGPSAAPLPTHDAGSLVLPPVDVAAVTPQGPLDARYRIEARGRTPRWAPTAAFNDGVRTFVTLSPDAGVDEAPALFVRSDGELQLVNYRQADGVLIVDRVFDEAELRLGDRRPQVVRIRRLEGDAR